MRNIRPSCTIVETTSVQATKPSAPSVSPSPRSAFQALPATLARMTGSNVVGSRRRATDRNQSRPHSSTADQPEGQAAGNHQDEDAENDPRHVGGSGKERCGYPSLAVECYGRLLECHAIRLELANARHDA